MPAFSHRRTKRYHQKYTFFDRLLKGSEERAIIERGCDFKITQAFKDVGYICHNTKTAIAHSPLNNVPVQDFVTILALN